MSKKIIILGGYAQAGKSTAIELLKELGVEAVSTSTLLHEIAERFFKEILGVDQPGMFQDKSKQFCFRTWESRVIPGQPSPLPNEYSSGPALMSRDILIKVAESILVPTLGRKEAFVAPVVTKAVKCESPIVVIECIGGHEWDLMQEVLENNLCDYTRVNIRRESEQPDADYRELLPDACCIWNDDTKDALKLELKYLLDALNSLYLEEF